MASTFSPNLSIELIGTGDQAGTWGTTTNSNLGTLIEQAISGYVTQAVATGTDTTITIPNGSTGVARNMYIELTGTGGTNTNLIVPANKKLYFIFNNSTGAVTVKVSGQTGVSVPTGKKMVLVSNGTDIVNGLNYIADFGTNSFSVTNLTASSATITNLIATSGSITNLVSSDASATVLRAGSATLTHLSATSASITNLTLTSLVISNLSIASANITTLTGSTQTLSGNLTLSGGTANGVLYLNGSKVATSGSALVFDGTNLGIGTASPGNKLVVNGSSGTTQIQLADSTATNNLILGVNTSTVDIKGVNGFPMAFYTANAERMRLDTSGNLGIGTASPGAKLDVSSTTDGDTVRISFPSAATGSTGGGLQFRAWTNSAVLVEQSRIQSICTDGSASYAADMRFMTANAGSLSEKMRLNSAGNLGLGVTPSAWSSTLVKAIQIADNGCSVSSFTTGNTSSKILNFNNNAYYDAGGWKYVASSVATSRYELTNGEQRWYTAPSGTAGNAISFTQAMTLNASGNLSIGATDANNTGIDTGLTKLFIVAPNSGFGAALTLVSDSLGRNLRVSNQGKTITGGINANDTEVQITTNSASPLVFSTSGVERARFTSGGDLLVGTTSNADSRRLRVYGISEFDGNSVGLTIYKSSGTKIGSSGQGDYVVSGGPSDGFGIQSQTALVFGSGGTTERARITSGGDVVVNGTTTLNANAKLSVWNGSGAGSATGIATGYSATSGQFRLIYLNSAADALNFDNGNNNATLTSGGTWTNASDARLKKNIQQIKYGLDTVLAAQPRSFNRVDVGGEYIGFIAQELQAQIPEVVYGNEDTKYSVDYGSLVAVAFRAIQEQQAIITSLNARITALESK